MRREAMALWSEFLQEWPPDKVRGMSLEEYTNPNRDDAFIYWLEFRTESLGSIAGGSAFKFGVFHRNERDPKDPKGGRFYGDEYAWMGKYGETADAAFATVRSQLTAVIDAVRAGDFEAVDQVDFSPAVKWKVAFLYQDREDPGLLAIYKEERLAARYKEAFPDAVQVPPPSQQHAALIEHYSWKGNVLDISSHIWLAPGEPPPSADRRYWLMSLGRQSRRWPACYESGTATIGYDDYRIGDLRRYESLEEVGRAIESDARSWPMHDRLALWEFSHVMKPGDVIFVKRGNDAIGHGTVRSNYRYDGSRASHRHVRDVGWESNFPVGVRVREKPLVVKTLTDITKYPDQVRAFKQALQIGSNDTPEVIDTPEVSRSNNQILYGPPGTGKTYETVSHALAVVDGVDVDTIRNDRKVGPEAVLERYSKLRFKSPSGAGGRPEGQIAMVTFHQNYAYEDFVEGIRPKLTKAEEGGRDVDSAESGSAELLYELRPGIFRSICRVADEARRNAKADGRQTPRYVLVIDEINRGNIPKIFGELITLIEPSRRLGAGDETTVTLPYSGHDFGVPNNLYIIGTMNTADRSIQQMDTALRRRFTFVEMMPDPDHELIPEDVEEVNCRKMLRAMNERIALLLDREHQIGHTYLLNVKTMEKLADRFRNRIFPLLQEYFYDDWRKIRAVLGNNAFVQERPSEDGYRTDLAEDFGLDSASHKVYDRLPLDDESWKDAEQYKQIYANSRKS